MSALTPEARDTKFVKDTFSKMRQRNLTNDEQREVLRAAVAPLLAERDRLAAELEKLRAALESIAKPPSVSALLDGGMDERMYRGKLQRLAREALGAGGGEK